MTGAPPTPETEVPTGERAPARCPYCDRPFAGERLRDLHVGEVHPDACTDEEREAYERAREAERDDLFTYHINVVILLGVTYTVVVLTLLVLLGGKL